MHKLSKHGKDYQLKKTEKNENGKWVIPKTEENAKLMQEKIHKKSPRRDGTYYKGEKNQCEAIHYYDEDSGL